MASKGIRLSGAEADLLWQAILGKIDDLIGNRGHGRSTAYYANYGATAACRCLVSVVNGDGSDTVYDIQASRVIGIPADDPRGETTVHVSTYRDDHDASWEKQAGQVNALTAIVDHDLYEIGPDLPAGTPGYCLGFGGREHKIEFLDGRTFTTRNLWHRGKIPPSWRDRLPDNARWAPPATAETTTVQTGEAAV
jgi:hypothetical protein